jgi:hypothetical protein
VEGRAFVPGAPPKIQGIFARCVLVFLVSYLFFFLAMSLRPDVYDEGTVLPAAMRVNAGQIPHRDFYIMYGPAQFYILAGLFKLFGKSLLIERLYHLLVMALVASAAYGIASSVCSESIALGACIVEVFWIFSLNGLFGLAIVPVSLLNLISCALLLPLFRGPLTRRRLS